MGWIAAVGIVVVVSIGFARGCILHIDRRCSCRAALAVLGIASEAVVVTSAAAVASAASTVAMVVRFLDSTSQVLVVVVGRTVAAWRMDWHTSWPWTAAAGLGVVVAVVAKRSIASMWRR